MDLPELLEDGRSHARLPRIPSALWRVGWAAALLVVAGWVVTSHGSQLPSTPRPATTSASVDAFAAEQADTEVALFAVAQRNALIRDVPDRYRDAAARASAMRGDRTPGNFFLALACERTLYGDLLVRPAALAYTELGPVQWKRAQFDQYAEPGHRDVSKALDSFLAVDTALHRDHDPDFSTGALQPARILGMDVEEARSVADIYDILDGSGVRERLPN
jgi:hypothetical protein